VVEPGAGCGILIAALAEQICRNGECRQWHVTAYEIDSSLRPALYLVLSYVKQWLGQQDIEFGFDIVLDDFILANASHLTSTPLLLGLGTDAPRPDLVIANPPYFKVRKSDPRVALLSETVYGQPNVYTLFMAAAAKLLEPEGELVFITPRSFCAGPYFQRFRKWFFKTVALKRLHLFESRTEAFDRNEVLQENIIIAGTKTTTQFDPVDISVSQGVNDLASAEVRQVAIGDLLDLHSDDAVLSIPVQPSDFEVRALFGQWTDRLHTLGLEISTGPIVPFRTDALVNEGAGADTTPVVWVQHVERMAVTWPQFRFAKPQWLHVRPDTYSLLLPNSNYVLVRRFSAKEDNSRITAAPYLGGSLPSDYLGIENHVNYIHRPGGKVSESGTWVGRLP
jgi:adenine-specific DNA-methyltransferase